MNCRHCQREIADGSNYCSSCGADQRRTSTGLPPGARPLRRSATDRKIAGVCGGIAEYLGVEVTIVRLIWVIVSIVPGAVVGGVIAYLLAWLLMPDADAPARSVSTKRLARSATNWKIAGVCGGLGEYFGVDPTAARLLWAVLTIVPGFILGGIAAYVVAWLVMPAAALHPPITSTRAPQSTPLV